MAIPDAEYRSLGLPTDAEAKEMLIKIGYERAIEIMRDNLEQGFPPHKSIAAHLTLALNFFDLT